MKNIATYIEVKEHGREEIKQASTKDDFGELSNITGDCISNRVFDYYLKEGEAMVKTKNTIKFMLKQYMLSNYIESFRDLAKETGIDYQTLLDHIARPELFRQWEIRVLDEILHFSDEDLLKLIRDKRK